jgi:hypothetical protein
MSEMDMTFDIKNPADLFERVLLPTYQEFIDNNASRHALQGVLVAYHLFDWVNDEGFTDEAFDRLYREPEHREMVRFFRIARGLANGFKHFESPLRGQARTGPRVVTSTQTGFSADFSEDFAICAAVAKGAHNADELERHAGLATRWSSPRRGASRRRSGEWWLPVTPGRGSPTRSTCSATSWCSGRG